MHRERRAFDGRPPSRDTFAWTVLSPLSLVNIAVTMILKVAL